LPGRLVFDPVPTFTPPPVVTPTPVPTPLAVACPDTPAVCRAALVPGKSTLSFTTKTSALAWKWSNGAATAVGDFGSPTTTASYAVCLYANDALVAPLSVPAGGLCDGKPCWRSKGSGFVYRNKGGAPDGITQVTLKEGVDRKARIQVKGKGVPVDLGTLTSGPIVVQIRNRASGLCWGTTFGTPFKKLTPTVLKAVGD
jgi:hypothetical protein